MHVLFRVFLSLTISSGLFVSTSFSPVLAATTCNGWLLKGEFREWQFTNGDTYNQGQLEEYFRGCWDGTTAWRNPSYPGDPVAFWDWWTTWKPTVIYNTVTDNYTALVKAWLHFDVGNGTRVCPTYAEFRFRIELSKTGTATGYLNDSEPCWPTVVDYWLR